MPLIKKLLPILLLLLPATSWSSELQYYLDVRIDTAQKKIAGIARLKSGSNLKIVLSVSGLQNLTIDGVSTSADTNSNITVDIKKGEETRIFYEALRTGTGPGLIDNQNVFLTNQWYPLPDVLAEYSLSVTLPDTFTAISESEEISVIQRKGTKTFKFFFTHPLDSLHLAASTRYVVKKENYNGIDIETYFFKEDAALADTYMVHTKNYLAMYEEMLTSYPYKRFAIVENIFPTGYSMPTFTLLGREVIKLPFIVKTSLGHEILHQWFGNSVYSDYSHGNWAEGITNYLADHLYADNENRGKDYRKQIMIDYNAYVNQDNAMAVNSFINRRNKAQSAIGYGKSAMFFHMLRQKYGDESFFNALREFISRNTFSMASWHDIQRAFEKTTRDNLYFDFEQWLNRRDIPDIEVQDAGLRVENGKLKLRFNILQKTEPYKLFVPVTIKSSGNKSLQYIEVNNSPEPITITLDEPPTDVVIDENYSIMRRLNIDELPPVLADIMGSKKITVAVTGKQRGAYQVLIEALGIKDITWLKPEKVTFSMVKEDTFLIAGFDNSLCDMLLGGYEIPRDGIRLKVYKNPYNQKKRILLLHVKNKAEARSVNRKISHYGKYSELAFSNGRNTYKAVASAKNGIPVFSRTSPIVLKPSNRKTIEDIFPELMKSRIIFVGENHDRFAHHINQLNIIRKLHKAGVKIGVGMEMFQKPYQKAVDDYLVGRINEAEFLKQTEYFNKWRYDYNLYKPIIDFLKQNNIPLVALNIDGNISKKTAREGIDSLSKNERKQLPDKLDFSNQLYRGDLHRIFDIHSEETNLKDFNQFFQAQTLWDETMADSAANFLADNPASKLVIFAGNGHVRHKYGIPQRLYRRVNEPYTVIVQDEEIEDGIADYVLITTKLEGEKSPKLGVMVEKKEDSLVVNDVMEKGPAGKAGLQKEDIITKFSGFSIKTLADLKIALFSTKIGDRVSIQVERDGKTLDIEVELTVQTRFSPHFKK
ncbi:MAG: PDZ domain-containing protein [Deltaproteobacteria bacterium]|nr:PDZ domain-containing protein [Deltaproteobacteria bacterium]